MALAPLPIDAVIPEILSGLRQKSNVVLRAPTGAGKTTRVPPAILDAGLAGDGSILVLQPRRVAARATAVRMASERGVELGGEIGYQTRFDRRMTPSTRIACITEGILLRCLLNDPFLEGVSALVFDEFHERNLASDLALGMVRQVQQTVRPELKIVVMSATLDPAPLVTYLDDCPTVESEGRTFPVTIEHLRDIDRRPIDALAAWGVHELLPRTLGDILVFLPGVGEIRSTARHLESLRESGVRVHQLYGDLPPEQQDAVLQPSRERKVILSTNVAETSLTIEGVTGVVDTGLARVLRYDDHTGLDRLELTPISQASAQQRAGRAGRTAPGVCLRLWPESAHRARPERETPEIRRIDLAGALLQLACWIEPDVTKFPWFEPPRALSIEQSQRLLQRLDAVDAHGITGLGRIMAQLPLHPRLARMLVEGARLGQADRIALGAALLSERDPFLRTVGPRRKAGHTSNSDLLDRITALEEFQNHRLLESDSGMLHRGAAESVLRTSQQLARQISNVTIPRSSATASPNEAVLQAVFSGFPDRLARRRELNSRRGVMVGGRGVRLADTSAVDQAELFVCLDVDAAGGEALVRQASEVQRSWLPDELVTAKVEVFFDEEKEQLTARRRVLWDDLILEESPASLPRGETATNALVEAAVQRWDRVFPPENEVAVGFLTRVQFLGDAMPEMGLPKFDREELVAMLPAICSGRRSLAEVRKGPWLDYLRSALTYQQLQTLEREAPERLQVPSGNRITLQYERGKRPVLAVKIQELFGLADTPRLAGGRVPVLLHLLAPNMRPQQITDDLKSFWNNTYQQVRKDLRGRYPKHAWPEDPWNAPPQRRHGRPA